jgi:energy-coupling factor transporter ATP-binding protein EcfA2
LTCGNSACKVGKEIDAKCIEGFEVLSECPHFSKSPEDETEGDDETNGDTEAATTEVANTFDDSDTLDLLSGKWLTVASATEVCMRNKSLVFGLIGPVGSGKTSLVAAIYQLIADAKINNYIYARSLTLNEFERTSHDTRGSSNRKKPDMKRTPHNTLPGGVVFYHLCLKDRQSGMLGDLLLADRTGEDYKNASSDNAMFLKFPELKRADCISILVDGEKLASSSARHRVKAETVRLLRAIKDSQVLSSQSHLCLILTKLDVIEDESPEIKAKSFSEFTQLVEKIKTEFGDKFKEVAAYKVAASPEDSNILPYGHGVEDVIDYWLKCARSPAKETEVLLLHRSRAIEKFSFNARVFHEQ